uniref:Putative triose-phosphate transporter family n=1 Tax=Nyssomyia neivai TaxID=330878 RepID=A0A1L8DDU9_9DIPT
MSERKESRQWATILLLCILWYIVSSSNNVIGKLVLSEFSFPCTVTMVQLLSITLYSGPFFNLWGVRKYADMSWRYYAKIIIPLALGKFLASVSSHISIWKVPVSYAHTVKATMPLFTVILSRIILKEKHTTLVYLSLVPIITGVGIATVTEISFDKIGLICALLSTMGFSLQNIFSKKVLKDTGVHHLRLLHILGRLAFFMFLPVWFYMDFFAIISHPTVLTRDYKVLALLFTDGVLNWLQNIIAFSVLSLVTPLTYAVASASKRIFVIGVSLLILGNPVTWMNIFGMVLAILGVLGYNRAKHLTRHTDTKPPVLPFTNKQWNYSQLPTVDNFYGNGKPYTNGGIKTTNLLLNNNTATTNKLLFV